MPDVTLAIVNYNGRRYLEDLLASPPPPPPRGAWGGVTPLPPARRTHIDGTGDLLRRNGYPDRRGHGEPDDGRFDAPREIFAASGTASLFRRAAFADVGTYDAHLVAYYEGGE